MTLTTHTTTLAAVGIAAPTFATGPAMAGGPSQDTASFAFDSADTIAATGRLCGSAFHALGVIRRRGINRRHAVRAGETSGTPPLARIANALARAWCSPTSWDACHRPWAWSTRGHGERTRPTGIGPNATHPNALAATHLGRGPASRCRPAATLAVIDVRHGLPLPANFCPAFGYDLVMMAFWGCTSRWAMVAAFRTFFETAPNAAARACGLLLSFVSGLVFYIWYIRATVFSDPPPPFGDAMLSASAPAMIRLACMGFRCGAG